MSLQYIHVATVSFYKHQHLFVCVCVCVHGKYRLYHGHKGCIRFINAEPEGEVFIN